MSPEHPCTSRRRLDALRVVNPRLDPDAAHLVFDFPAHLQPEHLQGVHAPTRARSRTHPDLEGIPAELHECAFVRHRGRSCSHCMKGHSIAPGVQFYVLLTSFEKQ
ncbi:hypothetical protein A0H81_05621 [Grifola frondosa]|uniref:Uncharacterized protein n=1 Tax=Grifola frondosa TaxID=5627 RepID=A0A1C7MGZ5_GRIFR|nr:hypothetical protein A0H81_05621 [Grifola frondosa]